jgi:hypothetical protein
MAGLLPYGRALGQAISEVNPLSTPTQNIMIKYLSMIRIITVEEEPS